MNPATPERPAADRPPGQPPNRPGRPSAGLNFWQWLGIAIIAVVVVFYLWRWLNPPEAPPQEVEPPAPTHAQTASGEADGGTSVE